MNQKTQQFVERMGLLSESDGLSRIAGRIFGFLLVTPGECSLDGMAEALGVSRASVSTEARRLAQIGIIERVSRPGDRRDYYLISPTGLARFLEGRVRSLRQFHAVLDEGRRLPQASPEVRARLAAWDDAHQRILAAMTEVLAALERSPGER